MGESILRLCLVPEVNIADIFAKCIVFCDSLLELFYSSKRLETLMVESSVWNITTNTEDIWFFDKKLMVACRQEIADAEVDFHSQGALQQEISSNRNSNSVKCIAYTGGMLKIIVVRKQKKLFFKSTKIWVNLGLIQ